MRKSLFSIALIASAATAAVSDWVMLGSDPRGVTVYFDRMSVRNAGNLRYYSLKYVAPSPINGASYSVSQEAVDCEAQTVTTLNRIAYGADDKVVGTLSKPQPPSPIAPGSTLSVIAQGVCSK